MTLCFGKTRDTGGTAKYSKLSEVESEGPDEIHVHHTEIGTSEDSHHEDKSKKVSDLQAFWNIFSVNQGVVNLSMPYVIFKGTYISAALTIFIAIVANYTGKKVVRCLYEVDEETGVEVRVRKTFEDIGEAFGGKFWRWMVCMAMLVEMLSYCTLLLILCGAILHGAFPQVPLSQPMWSMIAFILVVPNAFMIQPKQIAFMSFLDVAIGQLVVVIVTVYCFTHFHNWEMQPTPKLEMSQIFVCIGTVVLSYSSQPYMPAIEGGMVNRDHFSSVMDVAFFMTTLVKLLFGLIGYLTYQSNTGQVITNNLPKGAFKITVNVFVMMVALCSFTFPAYMIFGMIDKIESPAKWWNKRFGNEKQSDELPNQTSNENFEDGEDDTKEHYGMQYCSINKVIVRLFVILFVLAIAVLVPHFVLFMSFVGNFTGMCVAFIFPCLFHMNLRKLSTFDYLLHVMIIVFGCVFSGTGLYSSTKSLIEEYENL